MRRPSAAKRGYDWAWQRLRADHLARHPSCAGHLRLGKVVAAEHVDHIESIRDTPHRRLDPTNLCSLCGPCHMRREREREAAKRQGRAERIRGCFVDGTPRNPAHPWYRGDPALRPKPGEKVN
jgi:HNH endonuclease